ncbi:MAG: hypothetical protein JW850_20320 [Thermoflexales bacterium]|nr:hypothetical protein [Thermoflexales bacterium]
MVTERGTIYAKEVQCGRPGTPYRVSVLADYAAGGRLYDYGAVIDFDLVHTSDSSIQVRILGDSTDPMKATILEWLHQRWPEARKATVPQIESAQSTKARKGKPGRRNDPLYVEAFQKIESGELTQPEAYTWFLEKAGIVKPEDGQREAFDQAMRRKRSKAT